MSHIVIPKDKYKDKYKVVIERDFVTEQSKDISDELLLYATININRTPYIIELSKLLNDIKMALEIDMSVFEYTLIYVVTNNIIKALMPNIYNDKMYDICFSIKQNESIIKNLRDGSIKPRMISFFAPHQLCPEKWKDLLLKMQKKAERENDLPTTDMYECKKCHQRKCVVRELQTRSIDEPMTKFITCCNCYNVFTK